jgi:hypothetical protein
VIVGDQKRGDARIALYLESDLFCPVCGFGSAFATANNYDTCARCGWVDDPDSMAYPDRKSEINTTSLIEARHRWPAEIAAQLAQASVSTLEVIPRNDAIGGYDYVVDGVVFGEMFSGARSLKAWHDGTVTLSRTPTGRRRLYTCSLCGGDDYERALTTEVHMTADRVVWSRIGTEDYQDEPDGWWLDLRSGPTGFAFDAAEYRRVFANVRT